MVDRLIGVGDEFAAVESESLVEVDAGAEGEDAGGGAGERAGGGGGGAGAEQAGGGAPAGAFQGELFFEVVDDRFDPLPDPADRRVGTVGLVGAARPPKPGAAVAARRVA